MSNRLIVLGSSAFFALVGLATAAPAAVIDTFSFSNSNGMFSSRLVGSVEASFSGSFTGSVEASGLIELSDLSAFQIVGTVNNVPFSRNSLSLLAFFSYDTGAGASSLGFIDTIDTLLPSDPQVRVCSGAPSVLSLACNPGGNNSVSTRASIQFMDLVVFTPNLTSVTLVSSVNTNVPEPSTWAMMLVGFAGLGLARYRIKLSSYILLRRQ
jgi:hypothetical protein